MDDVSKNIEEYNPNKKSKMLIVFNDMITDILSNEKLNSITTELFVRGRKLNISLVFVSLILLRPKNIKLKTTPYFIMEIPNKWELQQIALNHSSDIDFADFLYLCKTCTAKPYSFLVIDATLASDNS